MSGSRKYAVAGKLEVTEDCNQGGDSYANIRKKREWTYRQGISQGNVDVAGEGGKRGKE